MIVRRALTPSFPNQRCQNLKNRWEGENSASASLAVNKQSIRGDYCRIVTTLVEEKHSLSESCYLIAQKSTLVSISKMKSSTTPLLSSAEPISTYGHVPPNEDAARSSNNEQRFQNNALSLGRMFLDDTLSVAMMHSVGTLGKDEYVDSRGVIHTITIRKRRNKTIASGAPALSNEKSIPDYGELKNLFQQQDAGGERKEFGLDETATIEGDEYEVEDQVAGGSITAAVFGIIKSTVGPAILYLPKGFQQSGWAMAIPSLIVSTVAYVYSAHRLLQCWKVEDTRQKFLAERMEEIQSMLQKRDGSNQPGSDLQQEKSDDDRRAETLEAFKPKLLTYSELAKRAFGNFSVLIEFGIAAIQFGVCLTYLIFVPANLYASCQALFGLAIPKTYFLIGMLIVEIPCTWIRDIRKLTPFNVMATMLILYGLGSCLVISFGYATTQKEETILESLTSLPAIQPAWFMFIGTAFFCFEGNITVVVPLQEAVYKKKDRERFPMVNQHVTTGIVVFYVFFALAVWSTFGDHVQTALTVSLPQSNFTTSVQFAYAIAVILTYPLQAFPAMEVVYNSGTDSSAKKNVDEATKDNKFSLGDILSNRKFIASLLNIGLGVIAVIAIDYLGNVVSLIGSLVGMPLALIYPPIMHNILVKDSSSTVRALNYFVSAIGLMATTATTYATITHWDEGGE